MESALVGHSGVAEAAVVGATDDTTGQAIVAFVILMAHHADTPREQMIDELRAEVAREISPIARPREIHVVPELPKTRSGKMMRRLLRDVAEGRELGDPRRCWIPACSRRSGPASSFAASPQAPFGTKPEPGRFRLMTSPITAFIDTVTAVPDDSLAGATWLRADVAGPESPSRPAR